MPEYVEAPVQDLEQLVGAHNRTVVAAKLGYSTSQLDHWRKGLRRMPARIAEFVKRWAARERG